VPALGAPSRPIRPLYYRRARGSRNVGTAPSHEQSATAGPAFPAGAICKACPAAPAPDRCRIHKCLFHMAIFCSARWPEVCRSRRDRAAPKRAPNGTPNRTPKRTRCADRLARSRCAAAAVLCPKLWPRPARHRSIVTICEPARQPDERRRRRQPADRCSRSAGRPGNCDRAGRSRRNGHGAGR